MKKMLIIIQVVLSCLETGISIVCLFVLFFQQQNKMHAHLAGLIWVNHVLECI